MTGALTLNEVAHVIGLATAPAFLIGAVMSFISLLMGRMARVVDRVRVLDEIDDADEKRARLKTDMPRLRKRARLIHASMIVLIVSGFCTASVMIIAFLGALTDHNVEVAVAVLFVAALVLFCTALWLLAHEALVALGEFRTYL